MTIISFHAFIFAYFYKTVLIVYDLKDIFTSCQLIKVLHVKIQANLVKLFNKKMYP